MAKRIYTLGDARDERAANDAAEIARERAAHIRYLTRCYRLATNNGWEAMAERYAARLDAAKASRS